jgi:zinc protease
VSVDRTRLPRPGPPPAVRFPAIEKEERRGFRLWSIQHRELPVVAFAWLVPVGSAADPGDQAGLAALVVDLLDEGCAGRSMVEFHEALARIGAQLDVEIGSDAATLSLVSLARHADEALLLHSDMVCQPNLDEGEFERVRTLRHNRLVQLRTVPGAVADHLFFRQVYGSHPYGHPSLGTDAGLARVTIDAVRTFHRERFLGTTPTLVVAGDVTGEALSALIDRLGVAALARGAMTAPEPGPVSGSAAGVPRVSLLDRPGAAQSEIRVGAVGPARDTPDYHALQVANAVLGGTFMSRINLNLRERRGVTYGARSTVQFWRGPGPLWVQASVQTDATGLSIGEVLREMRDLTGERPVDEPELSRARDTLTRGYARNFETAEQLARAAAQLSLYELPDSWFDEYVPAVMRVDRETMTRVAANWFDPDRMRVAVVGDAARTRSEAAEYGDVAVVADPEELVGVASERVRV